MLADLILGIAAGAGTPYAEPKIRQALGGMFTDAPLSAMELRMVSFAVCLTGAAVLSLVFGDGEALPIAFGSVVGVFGPRIINRVQGRRDPDYGPDPDRD